VEKSKNRVLLANLTTMIILKLFENYEIYMKGFKLYSLKLNIVESIRIRVKFTIFVNKCLIRNEVWARLALWYGLF
jgi:hypothetical protein